MFNDHIEWIKSSGMLLYIGLKVKYYIEKIKNFRDDIAY